MMKKLLLVILSLVLCIACSAMPAYADELDKSGKHVDPERGYVYECGGDGYIYEVYDSGIVRITVTVEGHIYLDSNRNVTGFSYSSCSAQFAVISGLSPSELDVGLNYINYSVSNNVVTARVHYSVTINGATNTGYINIVMSEF